MWSITEQMQNKMTSCFAVVDRENNFKKQSSFHKK